LWAAHEDKEIRMGDRYELSFKCPICDHDIWCYYAESSGIDKVRCEDCKKEFKIVMNFKLREIQGDKT